MPAIAIVGLGAILPDAPDVPSFWENLKQGRYSVTEVRPDRWDPAHYYDPDPKAPDKTYSKIGGWVREWAWDPMRWRLPIPPAVGDQMDRTQKWAVAAAREALADYGWPARPLDGERTAVVPRDDPARERRDCGVADCGQRRLRWCRRRRKGPSAGPGRPKPGISKQDA